MHVRGGVTSPPRTAITTSRSSDRTRELVVNGADQLWVADLTYAPVTVGSVYVAVIIDAWSRRIIGYAPSRRIDARLTLAALDTAIALRQPPPGCVHHTDRGLQYPGAGHFCPADDPVAAVDGDVRLVVERRDRDIAPQLAIGGRLRLGELHRSARIDVFLARLRGFVGPYLVCGLARLVVDFWPSLLPWRGALTSAASKICPDIGKYPAS